MVFHSLDYLVFFVVVLLVYWRLPFRAQNYFLLVASYFFYGYIHPWFLILLTGTALIDFYTSNQIADRPEKKKFFLGVTLIANFGVLCCYKYLDFLSGGHALEVVHALGFTHMTAADVAKLLPVGLSFYTFQSVAYVVDVYRGDIKPQRSLPQFLAFVSFFPQLVAGPIQRASVLGQQLGKPRTFDARIARGALLLMLWGFFQKLVIADSAAVACNKIFSLDSPSFPVLWAGVFAFAIQIYADFAAYSNIARGTARMLGFELVLNFNHPYSADSIGDFWKRWHISLSTWFRDYVYIPLGGNRCSSLLNARNIMLTFLLSGLWHGASWNFLIWGGYHGLLLVLWKYSHADKLWKPARVALVFVLVCIGWLFFRETNLAYAWNYLTTNPFLAEPQHWRMGLYFVVFVMLMAWPLWAHRWLEIWWSKKEAAQTHFAGWKWAMAQMGLATLLLIGLVYLRSQISSDFIYFQF